jgi:hypothetical protein
MIDITLNETIDRVMQTPQNNGGKRMCFGSVSCSCSSSSPYRGNGKQHIRLIGKSCLTPVHVNKTNNSIKT